ncbi:hypothetical protein [Mesorhizobium sp. M0195]|uniref:hypothetical protein n=1 Tax=Mesorhizobium sp. M0195 TaxID=2956910 RepID=UPI00333E00C9
MMDATLSRKNLHLKLAYTNWRGETSIRTITPDKVYYGTTEWHPEPQWLLTAYDHDKLAVRDFALKGFGLSPDRERELLEANNRYQQEARDARAEAAAHIATLEAERDRCHARVAVKAVGYLSKKGFELMAMPNQGVRAIIQNTQDYDFNAALYLAPATLSNLEAPAVVDDASIERACEAFTSTWADEEPFVKAHYQKNMRAALSAALVATPPAPASDGAEGLVKERDEAISQALQWKTEAERLRAAHRADVNHPMMTLEDVITWLKYHRFTHSDWASWFEAHPDDPRIKSGIGTADFHRKVEARYNEMIRCLTTALQPAPTSVVDGEARDVIEELQFALHSNDLGIQDRADQAARLYLAALSKAQAVPTSDLGDGQEGGALVASDQNVDENEAPPAPTSAVETWLDADGGADIVMRHTNIDGVENG